MKSGWNERLMWRLLLVGVVLFIVNQILSIAFTVIQLTQSDFLVEYIRSHLSK